jgi:predicted aspartyl protease
MKAPTVSAILAVAALRSCALAVITLPIARIPQDSSQLRRRDSITEILGNNETGGWYTAEASVGTPAQNITFLIDTGSSDFARYLPLRIYVPMLRSKDNYGVDVYLLVSR